MRLEQNHNYSVILSEPRHIVPEIGRGYGERAWLRAVKDWENTDGSRGLDTPLKDWDPKWLKESGQSTKYHQREIVALEFISRFARNKDEFCSAYPEHKRGLVPLAKAITLRQQEEGLRKRHRGKRTHSQSVASV
ncbi:hypothetical protein K443DRAFT_114762 [Laccaria amethystina LaAM-08-1]|uniref:Uncharacterized protein n=1 Tax=Laccaria amethystina LaAM-08-1 TaxID=1095629 RepID=A0A0C9WHR3_9AGAR|nr:hypothetical protein K443DRAFT_114762 [Laccaria amethystina LaAM-08-1]